MREREREGRERDRLRVIFGIYARDPTVASTYSSKHTSHTSIIDTMTRYNEIDCFKIID